MTAQELRARAAWYAGGCDGLEDRDGYLRDGLAADAASDLNDALDQLAALSADYGNLLKQSNGYEEQLAAAEQEIAQLKPPPKLYRGHIDPDCEFVRGVGAYCTCETPEKKAEHARELAECEAERDALDRAAMPSAEARLAAVQEKLGSIPEHGHWTEILPCLRQAVREALALCAGQEG